MAILVGVAVSCERGTPVFLVNPGTDFYSVAIDPVKSWSSNEWDEKKTRAAIPRSMHRGTSLTRNRTPLGPYRSPMPRVLGGS